eukprot:CAMPEP_0197561188 /NCGR_PEP_ID=MMETSP1320-20131121/24644_1 /TAXON_ID=91990 /ORGANISM="Bolidomonas sp., Strain RCC2347" /LENGTH=119 /DNA_ID=CAMNT_0043122799 /DNA_START=369 /DNA_END=728 /DNA_ORIENTATION=+
MGHDEYYPAGRIKSDQILSSTSLDAGGEGLLHFLDSRSTEESKKDSSSTDVARDYPTTSEEKESYESPDPALVFDQTSAETNSEEDSVNPSIREVQMQVRNDSSRPRVIAVALSSPTIF